MFYSKSARGLQRFYRCHVYNITLIANIALRVRSFMQGEGPSINDVRIEQERRVGPDVEMAMEVA